MNSVVLDLDNIWINSEPVDLSSRKPPDCFTTRPIRLNKLDEEMNLHAMKAIRDWTTAMCDGADVTVGHTFSPVGNVSHGNLVSSQTLLACSFID